MQAAPAAAALCAELGQHHAETARLAALVGDPWACPRYADVDELLTRVPAPVVSVGRNPVAPATRPARPEGSRRTRRYRDSVFVKVLQRPDPRC